MRPLSKLSYKEKRKKLITELTKKTSGALNSTEIHEVVSKLNVNLPYQLEFIHSHEKMEKILTLKQWEKFALDYPNYAQANLPYKVRLALYNKLAKR